MSGKLLVGNLREFLALACCLFSTVGCASLRIDAGTRLSEVRALVGERLVTRVGRNLDAHLDRVAAAFASGDRVAHAESVLLLLRYADSLPTSLVATHADAFLARIDGTGVEPYLSYYIGLGRRLSCASTTSSLDQYRRMIRRFAEQPPPRLGSQIVFVRRTCHPGSDLETLSDNVGWAMAAVVFSELGRSLEATKSRDLFDWLAVVESGIACAACSGEFGEIAGTNRARRSGLAASSGPEVGADPESGCAAFSEGLSRTIAQGTQGTYCRASNDLEGVGFGAATGRCAESVRALVASDRLPPAQTTFDRMKQFDDYVACQNRLFNHELVDPHYSEMSQYFQGSSAGAARCRAVPGGRECETRDANELRGWFEDDRGNKLLLGGTSNSTNAGGATLEHNRASDSTGSTSSEDLETGNGSERFFHHQKKQMGSVNRSTYEHTTPDGRTSSVTKNVGADGKVQYKKTVDGVTSDATQAEYEAAKKAHEDAVKSHFPPGPPLPPSVRPGPDEPQSPCEAILARHRSPLRFQDVRELIQYDPDSFPVGSALEEMRACLENFDEQRRCHTELRCIDEIGEPDCHCESTAGGPIPREQCPLIQCDPDAVLLDCFCREPDGGGIGPGLRGPLVPGDLVLPSFPTGGPRVPVGEPAAP